MSQTSLAELPNLTTTPVAITFLDTAPAGVPHVAAMEPAACGYWQWWCARNASSRSVTARAAAAPPA